MAKENARQAAWRALNRIEGGGVTLDRLLEEDFSSPDALPKRERALFQALVFGVLRWRGRLDWIIGHFSRTRPEKIDPEILNLLRLGLFQITGLDRVPPSAAVNTSVEMAKTVAQPWVVGFVNANLRRMAREHAAVPFPQIDRQPVAALAAAKSFPEWLLKRWLKRFGITETAALCDAVNRIPPVTLRTNTLTCDRLRLAGALVSDVEEIRMTAYAPDGVSLRRLVRSVAEMPSFQAGWFQVQDEAAQLVDLLLDPQPGERILDACAGLGGKTAHFAQLMKNRGEIVALDEDSAKLQRAQTEMARLGVTIVKPLRHDLRGILSRDRVGIFDRVLVDAPCSGLGVVRRNPDCKWSLSSEALKRLGVRQVLFLENLAGLVRLDGILAYAVCSMEPEENEAVIKAFLNNHENFAIDPEPGGLPVQARGLLHDGYLRTFPHREDMDGFFSVRLRRVE